jgi:hypothetical protein
VRVDPAGRDGESSEIDIGFVRGRGDVRDTAVLDRDLLVAGHAAFAVDQGGGLDNDGLA